MKFTLVNSITLIISLWTGFVNAGIVVGGTRIVYDSNKREVSLSIRNPDEKPYLIQSWIDSDGPLGDKKSTIKPPFIVTPPLFRLDAESENTLRIIQTGSNMPTDRESIYWMNVKSIPSSENSKSNVLQISVKTRIKLFYRPSSLKQTQNEAYSTITFYNLGDKLKVDNPSEYYISFYSLNVGGAKIETANVMVPPKASAEYKLPNHSTNEITWQAINDYGGSSKLIKSQLR